MYNFYGTLATKVYELTKPIGTSLNGDIDYYSERLEGIDGTILEAGVGTGRMLIPLLEDGFDVHGVDSSIEMLEKCQKHLKEHALETILFEDDLTIFNLGKKDYSAIILPTSTFCLIKTQQLAQQVLENFYNHLASGGKIIFDLDLPFYPELNEVAISTHAISETEWITLERRIVEIDWLNQQIVSHLTYCHWVSGKLVKTELQPFLLRWYGLTEIKLMLEKIGFKNISISADYEFDVEPTDSNQTITVEAYKD